MNKALLGKQAWKIISEPNSLVASTLLPKYCRKTPFTKAESKPGCSWTWKNILVWRDVMLKGLDIQVWSGQQTTFENGSLVQFELNSSSRLKDLICLFTHTWKADRVISEYSLENLSSLKHKTFSIFGGQDKFVWKYKSNGKYTVTSAYWYLFNEIYRGNLDFWNPKLWKRLWSSRLPSKLILFLWKICSDCFPVTTELHKRVPGISPIYIFCKEANETI